MLAIFLGGLAAGYAVFGAVARGLVRRAEAAGTAPGLLRTYGLVEAGIGVYAFTFPLLFAAAQRVSLANPVGFEGAAFAFDVALTIALIGPPTLLMGGTIPLLTQGLVSGLSDATRMHALVYATNTLGAFAGAVAGAFVLLPMLGLTTAMFAMGTLNLAAGAVFVAWGRGQVHFSDAEAELVRDGANRKSAPVPDFSAYAAVALLAGFAMMVLQTTFNRIGAMSLGASEFTFATVVAAYVLCMALGSFAVSFAGRIPRAAPALSTWMLVAYLLALYPNVQDAPYWAHRLRTAFGDSPADFHPYFLAVLGTILVVLLVPLALSGALLPLLFHHLRRETGDLGSVAGRLYSWNTVGSLVGALTGGYLLLFWLDLHHVYRIAVVALVVAAAVLTLRTVRNGTMVAAVASSAAVAATLMLPAWSPDRLSSGLFRFRNSLPATALGPERFYADFFGGPHSTRATFYDDDPGTSVAVLASTTTGGQPDLSILVNGKSDGSTWADDTTTRLLALIPAILAQSSDRAFIIGYGTGVTAGELALQPEVREITVAEISSGVIAAAPQFEEYSGNVLGNPKVRVVRADAYRALLREPGRFDIIVSEPSNPRVTGVEMLYAKEFLEAARGRLTPGGVYAQWFHTSAMDADSLGLVLNTFRQVFPRASLWFTAKQDVLLIGFASEERSDDLERIREHWQRDHLRVRFSPHGIESLPALLVHELLPAGVLQHATMDGTVHTLLHPVLSHTAARAYFAGRASPLPATSTGQAAREGARNSLLGRLRRDLSDEEWVQARPGVATQACFRSAELCSTWLADWTRAEPQSVRLKWLVHQSRDFWGDAVDPKALPRIARLWDGSVAADAADRAEALDERTRYYSHAIPFP